jgi:glycosyltransferase involved in cell wall biosynthesis
VTKLVYLVTVPVTANVLLRGQLAYMRERGFDVTVISSPGPELDAVARREGVRTIAIPMARDIEAHTDVIALARITRTLAELKPDIVNAGTSKAGLLGMIAAAALRVPVRIYLLRGLRLETERGIKRSVLGLAERAAVGCAHEVICVSESLRARFIAGGFASAARCRVLGAGMSNGIDVERFAITEARRDDARRLRRELGIPQDASIIGFVGRPVADKGIRELLAAFRRVRERHPAAYLMLVGAGFADDHLDTDVALPNVVSIGRVDEPASYYAMMDVLAFPSHREGFPNAPIEAAAAGVPTVGSRATGVVDAVVDGETGLLVEPRDADVLATALVRYLDDPTLRARHGERARARVVAEFARERVWALWEGEYRRLLAERSALPGQSFPSRMPS